MRAILTRVKSASVVIDGEVVGAIGKGFLILLGVGPNDTEKECRYLAEKALGLRIFTDENDKMNLSVLDVGGDDRGALALGRYSAEIKESRDYEMLFVANAARPLTRRADETCEVMKEIETACKLPFTAIINNTNVGNDTSAEDVLQSVKYAEELSLLSGLPIKMTTVNEKLFPYVEDKIKDLFPLKLQELYYHIKNGG